MKFGKYGFKQYQSAYKDWQTSSTGHPSIRLEKWDTYCDMRDSVSLGTSKNIRDKNDLLERIRIKGSEDKIITIRSRNEWEEDHAGEGEMH